MYICSSQPETPRLCNSPVLAGNTFTVLSGEAHNTHCASSAGTGFPAQLHICRCRLPSCHPVLRLACYPFFLTASESRLMYALVCTYRHAAQHTHTHLVYTKCVPTFAFMLRRIYFTSLLKLATCRLHCSWCLGRFTQTQNVQLCHTLVEVSALA